MHRSAWYTHTHTHTHTHTQASTIAVGEKMESSADVMLHTSSTLTFTFNYCGSIVKSLVLPGLASGCEGGDERDGGRVG